MKILIKYNKKLSKWIVFLNNNVLFDMLILKINKKNYSIFFKNYFILLKILRQFGIKKSLKNMKEY